MTRLGSTSRSHYYIHEPAILRDGSCVIPVCWFVNAANDELHTKCWKMNTVVTDQGRMWDVEHTVDYSVSNKDFIRNFPSLKKDAEKVYNLPDPTRICGVFNLSINY